MRRLLVLAAALVLMLGPAQASGRGTSSSPVDDLIATCPSATEISAIDASLQLSFEGDTSGASACPGLTRLQERAYQALRVMQALHFTRPLPWTTAELYPWLTRAVSGIRFRSDIAVSFCCDPARVIDIQTGNLAALQTQRFVDPRLGKGLDDLVATVVHEARHDEGPVHTCGTNDATIAEGGAWAIQRDLQLWMALYSGSFLTSPDVSPSYYREQELAAADGLIARFCSLPTADLSVSVRVDPDPVPSGGAFSYTAVVHNAGPDPASESFLYSAVPGSATPVGAATPQGSCVMPAEANGPIGCSLGSIPAGATIAVKLQFKAPSRAGSISNRGWAGAVGTAVTASAKDPARGNNSAAVTTEVFTTMCEGRPVGGRVQIGTTRDDVLTGTGGKDVICGLGGNDVIKGLGGNDVLMGGPGNDVILGGPGNDRLVGGEDNDRLIAGPGRDLVDAGPGADRLDGGPGRDTLLAAGGNDVLLARDHARDLVSGGPGRDTATFDRRLDMLRSIERRL
ncbi:MAG: hypothetical protein QOE36_3385 [Gaiellaceae bacterium]|nr:hypothetical protein [Gaiellaceae bacterium]